MLVFIHFHLSCLYSTQLCLLAIDAGGAEAHAGVPHRLRLQKLKFITTLPSRGRHHHAAGRLMLDLRAELDVVLHTILHTVLHYQLAAHTHLVVGRASSGPSWQGSDCVVLWPARAHKLVALISRICLLL